MPAEALVSLRRRLDAMPARHSERMALLTGTAALYGVSRATLYPALRHQLRPRALRRSDCGQPRKLPLAELERYCEVVAALKLRTTNKKGRHLSTVRVLELMEQHGVETPDGHVQPPAGLLRRTTVNRYLRQWGYDQVRLTRAPAAVRFQARRSNELWQFDLSPSDLKHVPHPLWSEPGRGAPTLMLYSVVNDRSGVAYQEYRCVYGEDVEGALRFLFNAMTAKPDDSGLVLQGIPDALYLDNGPIAKSRVFQRVLDCLGVRFMPHLPQGRDGRRPTARSKGKVERPFRTVKEAHETLYHFHKPENEAEANLWLHRYLANYNGQQHRAEPHTRSEDWLANLPEAGVRTMCAWERYCAFAREPERRVVGGDARVSVDGAAYEVDADLVGETVLLWWGLFDRDLYVEHGERRYGPYTPVGGPIPLHRYRAHQKTKGEERANRIAALAERLGLPRAALEGNPDLVGVAAPLAVRPELAKVAFADPDPFQELAYPNFIRAKLAIADLLGRPLARLSDEERAWINSLLAETLGKAAVLARVRERFLAPRTSAAREDEGARC
ncbi:MAG: IS481 family transposase [Janthinobacterium lividum]